MFEVGQVEDLEVDAVGACRSPAIDHRGGFLGAARDPVGAQLIGLPPDRCGPASEGRLVLPDADHERAGDAQARGVATDRLAGPANIRHLRGECLEVAERHVELGRVGRGERRSSACSATTDHDRRTAGLLRLRKGR